MKLNKIAVVSAMIFAMPAAQAVTQAVTFSGTVASTCAFTNVQNGTLVTPASSAHLLTTDINYGGTPGRVQLSFNSTPTMSLPSITAFTSSPNISSIPGVAFSTTVLSGSSPIIPNGSSYSKTYSSGTSDVVTIDLQATTGNTSTPWPIGNYAASVTVTCQ